MCICICTYIYIHIVPILYIYQPQGPLQIVQARRLSVGCLVGRNDGVPVASEALRAPLGLSFRVPVRLSLRVRWSARAMKQVVVWPTSQEKQLAARTKGALINRIRFVGYTIL